MASASPIFPVLPSPTPIPPWQPQAISHYMSVSLLFFYSGSIPQTRKTRLQNQRAALLLEWGGAVTWTPRQKGLIGAAICLLKTQVQPPSGTHSRDPSYFGKHSLTGQSPLAPGTLLSLQPPCGPHHLSADSQLTAAPLGASLWAQPYLSSKSPQGSPIIIPLLHWGKCHVWDWRGISCCEPGRGGGADISPRLTHHVPPPLWPGCTPRLSLFPRALLRVPLSLPWGPVDSLQLPLVPVLMFSGCLNKAPQSGSFKHQKITSSHFWRVEVWDQGVNSDFFWRLANDCPPPLSLHDLSSHMAPTPQAQNVFPRCHPKHMTWPWCRMWVIPRLLVFLLTSPQGVSSSQCPATQLSPSDHSHCCGPWKRGSGLRMSTVTFTSPCPMALLSPPPTSEFSSHHL